MIKEGDKAPNFTVASDSGETISLKDFKGKSIVIYFYPKDNTPGCSNEAQDFRDNIDKFEEKDAVILGVSKDSVESHVKFKDKFDLPFALLSDESGEMCESYGVWQEKTMCGKTKMGIVRSTFVIDPAGKIKKIFSKVKVKGHVEKVLEEL